MKFNDFLNERHPQSNNALNNFMVNEAVSLKPGDFVYFWDDQKNFGGAMVHVATADGYLVGVPNGDRPARNFSAADLSELVWVDNALRLSGHTPVKKFNGNMNAFIEFMTKEMGG